MKIYMIGKKYGMRTVLSEEGITGIGSILYKCICECGTIKIVTGASIRKSISCGCSVYHPVAHSMSNTKIYKLWSGIIARCYNKKSTNYKHYGAKGITVSKEWRKFENFFHDMGLPPFAHSIERKDNNLGYSKENCKWATIREQNNNRNNVRHITFSGKTMNMTEWARYIGTSPAALHYRIVKLGLPIEIALTTPFTRSNSCKKFNDIK